MLQSYNFIIAAMSTKLQKAETGLLLPPITTQNNYGGPGMKGLKIELEVRSMGSIKSKGPMNQQEIYVTSLLFFLL